MKMILTPINIGNKTAKNRIVMSAMTRGFSFDKQCSKEMADYYSSRAEKGIAVILTEGIVIHQSGNGYANVPFIETDAQADSWKPCIKRVHEANSLIFTQLWHCGRISHSDFTGGIPPVSSSAIKAEGVNRQNGKEFGEPRALEISEIPAIIGYYVDAAKRSMTAGFDGVELHFGHGYLIDQFLDARINKRSDIYGGSIENRCRLAFEICEAVISAVGADNVIIRISPSRDMGGLYDWPDLEEMLDVLLNGFNRIGLLMLDISCANADYCKTSGRVIRMARNKWEHIIMGGASLSITEAEKELQEGHLDLVTFGRAIIANPDIVRKISSNAELIPFDNSMRTTLI